MFERLVTVTQERVTLHRGRFGIRTEFFGFRKDTVFDFGQVRNLRYEPVFMPRAGHLSTIRFESGADTHYFGRVLTGEEAWYVIRAIELLGKSLQAEHPKPSNTQSQGRNSR
jgi:hypothetical protein